MIEMQQHVEPGSRTATRGSVWVAQKVVDGVAYSARSRSGAPFALARELIAAGVEDQPVRVTSAGARGGLTYRSLAKMAGLTIAESATRPIHVEKWSEFPDVLAKNARERVGEDKQATPPSDIDKNPYAGTLAAE